MFNPASYENSRPDGFGVLEVVEGEPGDRRTHRLFVPLRRTELRGEVAGPLAYLRLAQTFRYERAECERTLEAVYRFPLPGDAAVTDVRVRFGEVEIRAELKVRGKAEEEYAEAKRTGRQAALATRESPDVFTLQVAGLQPDQEVLVETGYVQLARAEGAGWTLRVPLTTSPRYTRSDEETARHAQGQPLLLMRDPGHRFALDLSVRAASAVESTTHRLETVPEVDGLRVRLAEGEVVPDRDCVLTWRSEQQAERPVLHVLLHDDPASGQVYFLALASPPAQRPAVGPSREVVLLVDHSGSMTGAKWQAADWAVKQFLAGLTERDAFALGLFHDKTHWFARSLQMAAPPVVQKAVAFLEENQDSGGTELGVALEQGLSLGRAPGERARHVLVVTDAEVTDEGRLLRLAETESARMDRRRISVLCIDAAPNALLAHELAEKGGGVARFLTSAPEEDDITTALDEVLADWAEPAYAGLHLEVDRPDAAASGREAAKAAEAGWSAIDLGDLPGGRAAWVCGRIPSTDAPLLRFRLVDSGGREIATVRAEADRERPALKALFGARRVLALEFLVHSYHEKRGLEDRLRRLGYDPAEVLKGHAGGKRVYAENARLDTESALRGLLAREALDYGLASSETAFVAVRTEQGKPVEGTVAVANALPSGWSDAFVSASFRAAPAAAAPRQVLGAVADASIPAFLRRQAGGLFKRRSHDIAASFADMASTAPDPGDTDAQYEYDAGPPPARRSIAGGSPPGEMADGSAGPGVVFSGVPVFVGDEAILLDTARPEDAARLPRAVSITGLTVVVTGGAPGSDRLDPGLEIRLYVDDLSAPRARVRLADLLRQGGERPLNLLRAAGAPVRVVLAGPADVWPAGANMTIALTW